MMEVRRAPHVKLQLLMQRVQIGYQQLLGRAMLNLEALPPKQVPASGHPYSYLHPAQLPADLGRGEENSCPGGETDRVKIPQVKKRRRKRKSW